MLSPDRRAHVHWQRLALLEMEPELEMVLELGVLALEVLLVVEMLLVL